MYHATGLSGSLASNRLSWFYDLKGPSMTIDTACSSSLTAFHLACQSLRTGEAKMVSQVLEFGSQRIDTKSLPYQECCWRMQLDVRA